MTLINAIFFVLHWSGQRICRRSRHLCFYHDAWHHSATCAENGTADHIYGYEWMIILGGTAGNILNLFVTHLPVGMIGIPIYGLFSGIFVGCLAMALAENLRVIPVFVRRMRLKQGLPVILLAMALGKCMGSILQFFFEGT